MNIGKENRATKSYRVKPSITEKMSCIRRHLALDTNWWNENSHTTRLGFSKKGKVSNADVLKIAI